MLKQYLTTFLLALFSISCYGQTIIWETASTYSTENVELGITPDNKIFCSGSLTYANDFSARFFKYELNGSLIWQSTGRIIKGGPVPLMPLANGNILTAGYSPTGAFSPFAIDVFIQQLSTNGDTLGANSHTFVAPDSIDATLNILKLSENSFLLSGYTMGQDMGSMYSLRKIDLAGNTVWRRYFAKEINAFGAYTIRNSSNEFILYGTSTRPTQFPLTFHPYLVKVSSSGDSLLAKKVVVLDSVRCESVSFAPNNITQTANGDYLFSGLIDGCGSGIKRGFIGRVDSAFNLVWGYEHMQQTGLYFFTSKVRELEDGSILLLASDAPTQSAGFYLIRISASGQFISQTALQSQVCPEGKMRPSDWLFLPDSSIVVCGMCQVNYQGYIGRWGNLGLPTVAPDTTLVSAPELNAKNSSSLGLAFPNPAVSTVSLPYSLPTNTKTASIHISELATGRLVKKVKLNPEEDQVKVSLQHISAGFYTYTLFMESVPIATKKLVVIK